MNADKSNDGEPQSSQPLQGIDAIEVRQVGDWLLGGLIRLANKGLTFPVTLSCGGILISGHLIGGARYLKLMGQLMEQAHNEDEMKSAMRQWMEHWSVVYDEPGPSDEDDAFTVPGFIHLSNVKFFTPGQQPIPGQQNDVLWRGRLAAVDGFLWGTLSSS
jgi:hypothetical protein